MGHSQAAKADSHERILNIAARAVREGGLESLTIAELMKSAGLTHGAFYSHFSSRAELVSAAVERAMDDGERRFQALLTSADHPLPPGVEVYANYYLSGLHRDAPGFGCVMATLMMDAARDQDVRGQLARRLDRYMSDLTHQLGGDEAARKKAWAVWALLIGGVAISRLFDGAESDAILDSAKMSVNALIAREF